MDPEKKVWTLFSLLKMESPKVQKVSHWLSKPTYRGPIFFPFMSRSFLRPTFMSPDPTANLVVGDSSMGHIGFQWHHGHWHHPEPFAMDPNSVGVYRAHEIRIPVIKGWRSPIPKDQGVDRPGSGEGSGELFHTGFYLEDHPRIIPGLVIP